jgi:hypothetical protein
VPPQPFAIAPQFIPAGHAVIGLQSGAPQTFGVPPPPQSVPPLQLLPQSKTPPQPSAIIPH